MEIISAADYEERVLKSDKPVVVDFFATWCGPCKMLTPILEELNDVMKGEVTVLKIDIDEPAAEPLMDKYDITAVPTMLFVKNGEVTNSIVGLADKMSIGNAVKKMLV